MSLPDPTDVVAYEESLAEVTIGGPQPLGAPIEIRDYDPQWPRLYAREESRIRSALGERVVRLEHVGSTSVPGLPAKPVIDIALEVPDSSDEPAYVPDMEAAGYVLRIREPDWFEHRVLKSRPADAIVSTGRSRRTHGRSPRVLNVGTASGALGPDTNVNLHVFTARCEEVDRMLLFRDWLRANAADRELYANAKRELAARDWKYVQ